MKEKHFHKITPYLYVTDIHETIAYYKDQLGFSGEWIVYAPLKTGGISRDDIKLLFQQHPDYVKTFNTKSESFELVLFVANVDEIYNEYKSKNIRFIEHIVDRPWGIREFIIQDINGYWLRISEGKN